MNSHLICRAASNLFFDPLDLFRFIHFSCSAVLIQVPQMKLFWYCNAVFRLRYHPPTKNARCMQILGFLLRAFSLSVVFVPTEFAKSEMWFIHNIVPNNNKSFFFMFFIFCSWNLFDSNFMSTLTEVRRNFSRRRIRDFYFDYYFMNFMSTSREASLSLFRFFQGFPFSHFNEHQQHASSHVIKQAQ